MYYIFGGYGRIIFKMISDEQLGLRIAKSGTVFIGFMNVVSFG